MKSRKKNDSNFVQIVSAVYLRLNFNLVISTYLPSQYVSHNTRRTSNKDPQILCVV